MYAIRNRRQHNIYHYTKQKKKINYNTPLIKHIQITFISYPCGYSRRLAITQQPFQTHIRQRSLVIRIPMPACIHISHQ